MAEFKFLGYLADVTGVRVKSLYLETPTPLRKILPPSFPAENVIILVNQKVSHLDSLIKNEDSVVIMPIISGG
jgi:molybdopterin converting factor small subunit